MMDQISPSEIARIVIEPPPKGGQAIGRSWTVRAYRRGANECADETYACGGALSALFVAQYLLFGVKVPSGYWMLGVRGCSLSDQTDEIIQQAGDWIEVAMQQRRVREKLLSLGLVTPPMKVCGATGSLASEIRQAFLRWWRARP